MDKEQRTGYWLSSAAHDLDAAESLFNNGKHDWSLFIGHLVIEKVLKAFLVEHTDGPPPRTHNLIRLADKTSLVLSDEQRELLATINDFNIEARYPDYRHTFYELCTKEFTEEYFGKIKEMYRWLLLRMKP
jgi:HEPN domain-containing protein